jgi:hypothetical protein
MISSLRLLKSFRYAFAFILISFSILISSLLYQRYDQFSSNFMPWNSLGEAEDNQGQYPSNDDKLKIYVYDIPDELLPKNFTDDMNSWDTLEYYLWRALEQYNGRVSDPEEADFFFIPHVTALTYHNGFDAKRTFDHFRSIYEYVMRTHPYYNMSAGMDHVIGFGHDSYYNVFGSGSQWLPIMPPSFRKNVIHIVDQGDDSTEHEFDFVLLKDLVVVPPTSLPEWEEALKNRPPWRNRTHLGVFRGTLMLDTPEYSQGVRQKLYEQFKNDPDIVFDDRGESYVQDVMNAKFCIFVRGWNGWSERFGSIINGNCIPVIISDHYALPF